ncbi:hypothetical protein LE191_04155 [Janthinobacterium sp. HSC-3S05]|uniref:hypothetical protein n=1 Tax=Janthinobacterium lividum TaxID=29581 RepID=UPI001CD81BB0|nr:hypothetical protein [Janthinobacterium lividum]MCA1859302.1 hypothetical protein [Janthinobacterium lividum]
MQYELKAVLESLQKTALSGHKSDCVTSFGKAQAAIFPGNFAAEVEQSAIKRLQEFHDAALPFYELMLPNGNEKFLPGMLHNRKKEFLWYFSETKGKIQLSCENELLLINVIANLESLKILSGTGALLKSTLAANLVAINDRIFATKPNLWNGLVYKFQNSRGGIVTLFAVAVMGVASTVGMIVKNTQPNSVSEKQKVECPR